MMKNLSIFELAKTQGVSRGMSKLEKQLAEGVAKDIVSVSSRSFIFLIYLLLAVVVTFPLVKSMNTLVLDRVDGLLNTWMLNWTVHSLSLGLTGWQNYLNANIFYPYQNTFAFSDYQLPLALLAAPFVWLTGEPLIAYNVVLLLGLALTGYAVYLLVKHVTSDNAIGFFAGILFSFSTIHLNYLAHQQMFNFWPVVLATLFLLQKRYKLFVLMFLVAALTTVLFFYFLLAIVTVVILNDRLNWTNRSYWSNWTKVLGISVLLTAPFLLPYYLVSRTFNYIRPINDAIHFSFQIPDLLNVSRMSRLFDWIGSLSNNTPGYFGAVFLLLAIWGIRGIREIREIRGKIHLRFFLILAGVSFVLSLGPALHIFRQTIHVGPLPAIPLPYLIFYYLVPGFAGLRTPSRWILLTAFALAVAAAMVLKEKLPKGRLGRLGILGILGALVILEINWPFRYPKVPSVREFPPEQIWLRDNFRGAPIIQFPIYGWWNDPGVQTETLREYYSTIHWHPMFNGYSGFSPKEWEETVKWLQKEFPSKETVGFLRGKGIKLVLAPKDWRINLNKLAEFDKTIIYEIY